MRYCVLVCWLILGLPLWAQARVIWADDFSDGIVNNSPSRRFYHPTGEDYVISNVSAGAYTVKTYVFRKGHMEPATGDFSNALTLGDNKGDAHTSAMVTMDRFAPFDTSMPADRLMRIQFDMGVEMFNGATGLRFIIKPDNSSESNLIVGFGAANVIGRSPSEVFFFAANGGTSDDVVPNVSHVIGLNAAGTAFEPGFDFGTYDNAASSHKSLPITMHNWGYPFMYHFDITFDGTTYNGTVTRNTLEGARTDDVAAFSVAVPPATLSSTDSRDRFIITTGDASLTTAFVDNIEFSITPEPAGATLLIGLAWLTLQRRRYVGE